MHIEFECPHCNGSGLFLYSAINKLRGAPKELKAELKFHSSGTFSMGSDRFYVTSGDIFTVRIPLCS